MPNDTKTDRAWTMFLYASEDYQKALKAFESAKKALALRKRELHDVLKSAQPVES